MTAAIDVYRAAKGNPMTPCRDDRCEIERVHPSHRIRRKPGRPTGKSGPTKRQRLARRRRRHARKIAKLKAEQAANNRKILLGKR